MLDTMTFTKILGGFCGAFLVFLLGKWVAEEMYAMGGGHGHGDDHGPAYIIEVADSGAAEEVEEGPSFAELYASADPAAGEKAFGKCKACHAVEDGVNKTGPHLFAVVGRDVEAVGDFGYSGALSAVASVWTPEELDAFIENPKGYAPGTSMGFAGLKKPQDRANVVAYLDMTDGDMTELAIPASAEEEASAEEAGEDATEEASAEGAAEESAAEETAEATEEPAAEETTEEAASDDATEEASEEAAAEETPAEEETTEVAAAEETAEAPAEEEAAAAGAGDFAALVVAADIEAGAKAFKKCAACHVADKEQNRVGPHLLGVVGRDVASVDGFGYSDALTGIEGNWDIDKLSAWIESPRKFAPGNRMSFRGVSKEEDRANIIGYLQSLAP